MTVAVSASMAIDELMTFPGRFGDQLIAEELAHLSVSLLVSDLQLRRGGVAANICYGMAQLGQHPLLLAAIGQDSTDYLDSLAAAGVDTSHALVSERSHTARFICTTDTEQNQFASFYPGAMSEAGDIDVSRLTDVEALLVGPNDPAAMVAHTKAALAAGIPVVADPSQQLAILDGDAARALVDGAQLLFGNSYEAALLAKRTGWSDSDILGRVGTRITTHGAEGSVIEAQGTEPVRVPAVPVGTIADPTGVGDALRAGFLAARSAGLSLERAVQLGSAVATACLESVGPQDYVIDRDELGQRLADAYDQGAADAIAAAL